MLIHTIIWILITPVYFLAPLARYPSMKFVFFANILVSSAVLVSIIVQLVLLGSWKGLNVWKFVVLVIMEIKYTTGVHCVLISA